MTLVVIAVTIAIGTLTAVVVLAWTSILTSIRQLREENDNARAVQASRILLAIKELRDQIETLPSRQADSPICAAPKWGQAEVWIPTDQQLVEREASLTKEFSLVPDEDSQ